MKAHRWMTTTVILGAVIGAVSCLLGGCQQAENAIESGLGKGAHGKGKIPPPKIVALTAPTSGKGFTQLQASATGLDFTNQATDPTTYTLAAGLASGDIDG